MNLQDIIGQTIDIHVHVGPEIIPRKYTVGQLIRAQRGKIAGMVLKNHFYATSPFIKETKKVSRLKLFGSVVLNNAVGGLNAQAVYAASIISDQPVMVWFPTINAENFLCQGEFEIPPEWVKKKGFVARKSKDVKPVIVVRNNQLTREAIAVLRMIKERNAVLATGHISWKESKILVDQAIKLGIRRIVVTHPIYQYIAMPITIQKDLAAKGCFIEQSYSMYAIDRIPIARIAKQLKAVGCGSVILSSDVGQTFSPSPSQALMEFATLLKKEGVNEDELFTMLVKNPKILLGID